METEGGLRNPTIFLACCVLIHSLIIGLVCQKQILIILNIVGGVGMPFVTAGILFLIITRLFKASGTYEATFRVNAYAAATALFSWIPLVGFFLECYRLYLIVIGLSRVFSIRTSRAVLAMVITIIIYIAVLGPIIAHIVGSPVPGAAP
ncbi:MAG: YIP1 family protein [Deltaproteobacteria bacterium]|nr:YIP1 family protein [Deltaproteobacteria bacterium]